MRTGAQRCLHDAIGMFAQRAADAGATATARLHPIRHFGSTLTFPVWTCHNALMRQQSPASPHSPTWMDSKLRSGAAHHPHAGSARGPRHKPAYESGEISYNVSHIMGREFGRGHVHQQQDRGTGSAGCALGYVAVNRRPGVAAGIDRTLDQAQRRAPRTDACGGSAVGAWIARECGIEYQNRSGLIALLHRIGGTPQAGSDLAQVGPGETGGIHQGIRGLDEPVIRR